MVSSSSHYIGQFKIDLLFNNWYFSLHKYIPFVIINQSIENQSRSHCEAHLSRENQSRKYRSPRLVQGHY